MKKLFTILLALTMVLSLTACGSKTESTGGSTAPRATSAPSGGAQGEVNPVEGVFKPDTSSATGACATIVVSADVKMDDESAWLGLCPAGTDYVTEEEADEVDVIYYYYDYREEGEPYVYTCDFSEVEDGTYALVVTSSDEAEIGRVLIQLSMTKSGDKLTFDYTNSKYNQD